MYGEGRKEEKEEGREGGREKQEARSRTKIDDFLPSDRRINVRMGRPPDAAKRRRIPHAIHSWAVKQT